MRKVVSVAVLAAVALLGACIPQPPPGYDQIYITRDALDTFTFTPTPDGVVASGNPRNTSSNTRVLFWRHDGPYTRNQQVCSSFTSSNFPAQEGVALRISNVGHPGKAITVMKNIWAFAIYHFNVQLIDQTRPPDAGRITPAVTGVNYTWALQGKPTPWRICARVIGLDLSFKVWSTVDPEPAWDSPYTSKVRLPAGWDYPGRPGIYVGHLTPSASATYSQYSSDPLP